jgi:hypothetical protein
MRPGQARSWDHGDMNDPPAEQPRSQPPLIPPWWFVRQFNARPPDLQAALARHTLPPYRTALDPLVMLAWHQVTEIERRPNQLLIVTGI